MHDTTFNIDFSRFTKLSLISDDRGVFVPDTGSLVLVSGGAKMLRMKKDLFLKYATLAAQEHAKQEAFKSM